MLDVPVQHVILSYEFSVLRPQLGDLVHVLRLLVQTLPFVLLQFAFDKAKILFELPPQCVVLEYLPFLLLVNPLLVVHLHSEFLVLLQQVVVAVQNAVTFQSLPVQACVQVSHFLSQFVVHMQQVSVLVFNGVDVRIRLLFHQFIVLHQHFVPIFQVLNLTHDPIIVSKQTFPFDLFSLGCML